MTRAHVGLGSNLGDRLATLDAAIRALDADPLTHVLAVSRVYETEPVGGPAQGPYLNAAGVLETDRSARSLLGLLQATERVLGRVRTERWAPRTADLDLILYDGPPIDEPDLVVPHPRARERAFVLIPLLDADPYATFPDGQSVAGALAQLGQVRGVVEVGELEP